MIMTPFLRKTFLVVIVLLCIVYFARIYDGVLWIFDYDKIYSVSVGDRQVSVTIPKGVSSGPFSEPYLHPGYANSGTTYFYTQTEANPLVGGSGWSCFDSYERLMRIEVYGPGFLDFPMSTSLVGPDAKPTRMEKHGDNTFFEYDGVNSRDKAEIYYLASGSTIFRLSYLPGNCAWKDNDYSKYLDKILSSVKLSGQPMTQAEIDETNESIRKYQIAEGIKPKDSDVVDTQKESNPTALNQTQIDKIQNAKSIVDGLISKKIVKTENDCDVQIQKKGFDSVTENQATIYCVDNVRAQKTSSSQLSKKQTYQICGNEYSVQKIDKNNGIDLVQRFSELATPLSQKSSCDDFNSLFKEKVIGLDLKDRDNVSYLTMYDVADPRYFEQITMPTVMVSYDWNANEMYYFPSTLANGSANYLGKIK